MCLSALRNQACDQLAWPTAGGSAAQGRRGILDHILATCPKAEQIDVTGCTLEVVIRTFAVCARHALSASSPLELYERINVLDEEEGDRMQFEDLRSRLQELPMCRPHIMLAGMLQEMVEAVASNEEISSDDLVTDRLGRLLLTEVSQGSVWAVALVLSVKFDDIQCTGIGWFPKSIHLAVSRGDEPIVLLLVLACAAVEEMDEHESTPLLMVCRTGSLRLATMLVDAGAGVSAANDQGDTPLLTACRAGNLELAKMLVDAGGEVSAANDQGNTPLLAALMAGNVVQAEMLVRKRGADDDHRRSDGAGMLALAILALAIVS